jgi:hypothetical protein
MFGLKADCYRLPAQRLSVIAPPLQVPVDRAFFKSRRWGFNQTIGCINTELFDQSDRFSGGQMPSFFVRFKGSKTTAQLTKITNKYALTLIAVFKLFRSRTPLLDSSSFAASVLDLFLLTKATILHDLALLDPIRLRPVAN